MSTRVQDNRSPTLFVVASEDPSMVPDVADEIIEQLAELEALYGVRVFAVNEGLDAVLADIEERRQS